MDSSTAARTIRHARVNEMSKNKAVLDQGLIQQSEAASGSTLSARIAVHRWLCVPASTASSTGVRNTQHAKAKGIIVPEAQRKGAWQR